MFIESIFQYRIYFQWSTFPGAWNANKKNEMYFLDEKKYKQNESINQIKVVHMYIAYILVIQFSAFENNFSDNKKKKKKRMDTFM